MSDASTNDAMAALERLYRKNVVTLEEAQAAAKLITGDEATVFPPPQAPAGQVTAPDVPPAPTAPSNGSSPSAE